MNGIINIYKPERYTSFDCVAILRRALGIKKIGHTGTLDPMATGVLVCCVGRATRMIDYFNQDTKEYEGVLKLGTETDTYDIWGRIQSDRTIEIGEDVTKEEILRTFKSMEGEISQIPPKYSALKVRGKKLYEYAREGKEVDIKPRKVDIRELEVTDIGSDDVAFRLVCSKGTYVRSLCNDIGKKLGIGGTMSKLVRTRNGSFNIKDSLSIKDVKAMEKEDILKHMIPMGKASDFMRKIKLTRNQGIDFIDGKKIDLSNILEEEVGVGSDEDLNAMNEIAEFGSEDFYRIYGEDTFLGVARIDKQINKLVADKVLYPEYKGKTDENI